MIAVSAERHRQEPDQQGRTNTRIVVEYGSTAIMVMFKNAAAIREEEKRRGIGIHSNIHFTVRMVFTSSAKIPGLRGQRLRNPD